MANEKVYKGLQSALEALKHLSPTEQEKLLLRLAQRDPELVRQLKGQLFQFSDIANMAKADFKLIWFEIPRKLWLMSLRGASDVLMLFIRSTQSERAFNQLLEDLKDFGPQPRSKVIDAQKEVLAEIQSLAQKGRIHLPTNSDTVK